MQLGGFEPDIRPVSLRDLIHTNLDRYAPLGKLKQIRIDTDCDAGLRPMADRNMLDTVLRNLISNAIKFSPEGTNITIRAENRDQRIRMTITDQGQGIPPELQARLFQYEPGLSTRGTRGEVGTGLGLHLCGELLDQMAGDISVTSQPGHGSIFTITLPEANS